jgi:hypothetical protein
MHLDGIWIFAIVLVFMVVLVTAGGGAGYRWPNLGRRRDRYTILDETTPEELPDDDAPSKDDD